MNIKAFMIFNILFFSLFSVCFSMQRSVQSFCYEQARGQLVLSYSFLLNRKQSFDSLYTDYYLKNRKQFESHYRMLYSLKHLFRHRGKPARLANQEDSVYQELLLKWQDHFFLEILLSLLEVNIVIADLCDFFPNDKSFISDVKTIESLKSFYSGRTRDWFFNELGEGKFQEKFNIPLLKMVGCLLQVNKYILSFLVLRFNGTEKSGCSSESFDTQEQYFLSKNCCINLKWFWDWLRPLHIWVVENIAIGPFERIYNHVTFQDGVKLKEETLKRIEEIRKNLIEELKEEGARLRIGSCAIPAGADQMPVSELQEHLESLKLL